jgi:hypothetical protein
MVAFTEITFLCELHEFHSHQHRRKAALGWNGAFYARRVLSTLDLGVAVEDNVCTFDRQSASCLVWLKFAWTVATDKNQLFPLITAKWILSDTAVRWQDWLLNRPVTLLQSQKVPEWAPEYLHVQVTPNHAPVCYSGTDTRDVRYQGDGNPKSASGSPLSRLPSLPKPGLLWVGCWWKHSRVQMTVIASASQ